MYRLLLLVSIVLSSVMARHSSTGDGNLPKEITTSQIRLLLHQPQVESWKGNRIESRSAVILTEIGDPKPIFGVVSISARTEADREIRVVTFEDIDVKNASFPTAPSLKAELLKAVRQSISNSPRTVSRPLADLAITQATEQTEFVRFMNLEPLRSLAPFLASLTGHLANQYLLEFLANGDEGAGALQQVTVKSILPDVERMTRYRVWVSGRQSGAISGTDADGHLPEGRRP